MKAKLFLMCIMAASAAYSGAAMPTEAEVEKAVPKVERMLASEKVALESGKMTRAEVAAAAMKLAADADDEAAKLLLMKGAFILHVKDGDLEKAVKTMNALETTIADMPPQIITNIIETALLGLPNKAANGTRLYRLLDEAKATAKVSVSDGENLKAVVDGYTWTYRVRNGESEIVAEKDGKFVCAVSPSPKGDVTIPSTLGGVSVTRIGQAAFKGCKGMASVTIPSDVKSIGGWAFEGCSGLSSMEIPDGVKTIEGCTFWGCGGLKSVMIPSSVTTISDAAFGYCGGLTSMTIPPTVKELRTQVFFGCGALRSVTIPASVEKIGWAAFVYSGELKEINVEQGNQWFTSVGGALYTKDMTELVACPNALTALTIPPSVRKLRDAAIISCGKLESLTIPEGVTEIGWQAIKDCGSLKTVTIPSTVRSISEIAFCNCRSLTSVTIPAGVTSIGKRAFENCGALTSVTMRGERPNSPDNVFPKCANLKSIHVSANAKSWAGMKDWQGIPLVFDGAQQGQTGEQREAERAEQRAQLLAIQDELKRVRGMKDSSPAVHKAVESILKGMIKVPGRDFWLSATELTQEQWEPIMEFNLSQHKGAKLPVECVSRDDCDVFLEKLNQTKEVLSSGFEFRLPELEEWKYAAWAGSAGNGSWIKPGMIGNVLDMAWVKENSSNETHAVAMKAANAFGFYDMLGNVWEWLAGDAPGGRGALKGCAFSQDADKCTWNQNLYLSKVQRVPLCGLRLAAHKKDFLWQPLSGGLRRSGSASDRSQAGQKTELRQEIVNGYAWSYRVNNGEAEIVAENRGKFSCAASPAPTGDLTIPSILDGAKVTSIGREAFKECGEMLSLTMPDSVTSIKGSAFRKCGRLSLVSLPQSLRCIGGCAFQDCANLTSMMIPPHVGDIGGRAFQGCSAMTEVMIPESVTNIARIAFLGCSSLTSVTIPSNVRSIGDWAFKGCNGLTSVKISQSLAALGPHVFHGCSKLKSVIIPSNVVDIAWCAFYECGGLKAVTISPCVTNIGGWAFGRCGGLTSLTIPEHVTSIGGNAFRECTNLTSVTMSGECPAAPNNVFGGCTKLKSIHVSANAKSWAGMKEWQGVPLVFDAK